MTGAAAVRLVVVGLVVMTIAALNARPTAADTPSRPEEDEIQRLYRSVLDRSPDETGFAYWVSSRVEGVTLRAVADGFLNSAEYARRFGGGTDAEFVGRAYNNVLDRTGDAAGMNYWLDQLGSGLLRSEMVLLFSESAENRIRTGTVAATLPEYRAVVRPLTEVDLGSSWRNGCPVNPSDLRAVEVDHVDFSGAHNRGTLVVHATVADGIVEVFDHLYNARYPIESIRPIDVFAGDDDASMAANNTSGFNCRAITGGTAWSRHAYGRAIDINPRQNPYVSGQQVLPPQGSDFVDRATYHPAMVRRGDIVVRAFADEGWSWGGDFRTIKDYQHFER